jgi:two-component system, sensor histidine kinase and response regulator
MTRMHEPLGKVLAIDDNATNLEVIEEALGEECELRFAESGDEGLAVAREFRPDLILLDVMMAGIDGYEVCRRVRMDPVLRRCKVLMVSAKAMVSERLQGYEAGADDYITKPFDIDEFVAKVRVYLRLKHVEEVDQLKTEMLSLLCHETRTPLNGLLPPAEMLLTKADLPEEERDLYVGMIHENARRLHRLFERILALSKLRSGQEPLARAGVDLVRLIEECVQKTRPAAGERGVEVRTELPARLEARLDPQLIALLVETLVGNAVRYGPGHAAVRVKLSVDGAAAKLDVIDEGGRIPPERLSCIFDELSAPGATSNERDGLSLPIAREIARCHGGTLSAVSNPQMGTIFSATLPLGNEIF